MVIDGGEPSADCGDAVAQEFGRDGQAAAEDAGGDFGVSVCGEGVGALVGGISGEYVKGTREKWKEDKKKGGRKNIRPESQWDDGVSEVFGVDELDAEDEAHDARDAGTVLSRGKRGFSSAFLQALIASEKTRRERTAFRNASSPFFFFCAPEPRKTRNSQHASGEHSRNRYLPSPWHLQLRHAPKRQHQNRDVRKNVDARRGSDGGSGIQTVPSGRRDPNLAAWITSK